MRWSGQLVEDRVERERRPATRLPHRLLPLTAFMALVLIVVLFTGRTVDRPGTGDTKGVAAQPPAGATRPGAPSPLDLTVPFTGTPAASWPDGPDGIGLPAPAAVGDYTAGQVADAMGRVKQALVAAHLDDRMLGAHDPRGYLALLAPAEHAQKRAELTGNRSGEVTMFASGYHLLPVAVKVSGTMSTALDGQGRLVVHTNYVFAYPFAPTDSMTVYQPAEIVAIAHVAEDFTIVSGRRYDASERGLWVTGTRGYYESMACTPAQQGFLAPEYSQPASGQVDSPDPKAYYDPSHGLAITTTCPR